MDGCGGMAFSLVKMEKFNVSMAILIEDVRRHLTFIE